MLQVLWEQALAYMQAHPEVVGLMVTNAIAFVVGKLLPQGKVGQKVFPPKDS